MASSRAGYYLRSEWEPGGSPGFWAGDGAQDLGLEGRVGEPELEAVLAGLHPAAGGRLNPFPTRVAAVDLTFAVPKSVSVLWGLGPPEVARAVEAGRDAAARSALAYLERQVSQARPGGAVVAVFGHGTSRAADPHVHAHAVVANVFGAGERWRATDRPVLIAHVATAGFLFDAELRHRLHLALGARFGEVDNGVAQLAGMPADLRREFSRRRHQVEAAMSAHGGASPASARLAAVAGRPAKEVGVELAELRRRWVGRAEGRGSPAEEWGGWLTGAADRAPDGEGSAGDEGVLRRAIGHLSPLSSLSRRDVLRAVCSSLPQGAPVERVEELGERLLSGPALDRLDGPTPHRRQDVIRRSDGRLVVIGTDPGRWSTVEHRAHVRRAVEIAAAGRGRGEPLAGTIAAPAGSAVDRVAAQLCRSTDRVVLLSADGPPGAEAPVVEAAARMWRAAGRPVVAVAPDAASAAELEARTGVPAAGMAAHLDECRRLGRPPAAVVVIAGANGVPAAQLADALEEGSRRAVTTVLVAGRPGLPAADRGGAWRAIEA
ncbi:MAG TPA: MobF family relaxase, partial [Acidimicrobiales bacterium]|nr:MobF family relaxase [Acidimicrobiales bacterium]